MRTIVEFTWDSLTQEGEELCGDSVVVSSTPETFIAVLSDGLGHGVKANILSSLTAVIAERMFREESSVEDVIQTLVETLPECSTRKLAYATFAVLKIEEGRRAHLVEFDSPPLILVRDGEIVPVPLEKRELSGRVIGEARFEVRENDYLVLVSDGYEHAGLGGAYRFGWGWDHIARAVRRWIDTGVDTAQLTRALSRTCLKLYGEAPGDDSTVICMKIRPAVFATVLTGPPADRSQDGEIVGRLMAREGIKIVCGGTTAHVAARVLGQELKVDWVPPGKREGSGPPKKGAPPTADIRGVDLVTEGIITLGLAADLLRKAGTVHDLPPGKDAALRLARTLMEADDIRFLVGRAINPNQVADLVRGEPMRMIYVRELVRELEKRSKQVTVEEF